MTKKIQKFKPQFADLTEPKTTINRTVQIRQQNKKYRVQNMTKADQ